MKENRNLEYLSLIHELDIQTNELVSDINAVLAVNTHEKIHVSREFLAGMSALISAQSAVIKQSVEENSEILDRIEKLVGSSPVRKFKPTITNHDS